MILCGMLDLCRLILAIVIDLFRPRAAVEAEILVLRQQIIVLRRTRPGRVPLLAAKLESSYSIRPSFPTKPSCEP
jgi:hypothetical protein